MDGAAGAAAAGGAAAGAAALTVAISIVQVLLSFVVQANIVEEAEMLRTLSPLNAVKGPEPSRY